MQLSFVIITYRRAHLLGRCLESLDLQDCGDAEILVLFNGQDKTASRTRAHWALRRPCVKFIDIPYRESRGAARNRAMGQSRGSIVYFLDDDVMAPPGFARRVRDKFGRYPQASCIGGPNLSAPGATPFQTAADFMLRSPWGAGPMRVRYRAAGGDRLLPAWSFMLCNLGVRREVFAGHGLAFPERCCSAEENLLLYRSEQVRGPALYSPDLYVFHERRRGPAAFCSQVFQSGRGRMQITRMEPRSFQWVVLLPLLFLAYLIFLAFWPWTPLRLFPLGCFGLVCLLEAGRLFRETRRTSAVVRLPPLMLLGHVAYALGLLFGIMASVDRLAGWFRDLFPGARRQAAGKEPAVI